MVESSLFIAFVAGIVSFLSPCILPLIPAFLAYLAGTTGHEIQKASAKAKIFINTLIFVLGFSLVFSLLGILLSSILVASSFTIRIWLGRIGGVIIILFGLYLLGLIKLRFLEQEHKLRFRRFSYTYLNSFIFGAAFATGWTPCVGAVLGAILTLAVTQPGQAFSLLLSYSLGLGIPFLATGLFVSQATTFIRKIGPYLKYFNIIVGILLIILGILVFTNRLAEISNFPLVQRLLGY